MKEKNERESISKVSGLSRIYETIWNRRRGGTATRKKRY